MCVIVCVCGGCSNCSRAAKRRRHLASGRVDATAFPKGAPGTPGSPGGGPTAQTEHRGHKTDPPRAGTDPLVQERGGGGEERETDMGQGKRERTPSAPKGQQGGEEK